MIFAPKLHEIWLGQEVAYLLGGGRETHIDSLTMLKAWESPQGVCLCVQRYSSWECGIFFLLLPPFLKARGAIHPEFSATLLPPLHP